jgi:mRNA interferase RelE/StbE
MRVELHNRAKRQFMNLNEPARGRIAAAIDELKQDFPKKDIKKLKGYSNVYRLRIGSYRILYTEENNIRDIFKIAPRGGSYKEKK